MRCPDSLPPLTIAQQLQVPLRAISLDMGITERWLRQIAGDPKYARRIRVATLRAALAREELALEVDDLLDEARP